MIVSISLRILNYWQISPKDIIYLIYNYIIFSWQFVVPYTNPSAIKILNYWWILLMKKVVVNWNLYYRWIYQQISPFICNINFKILKFSDRFIFVDIIFFGNSKNFCSEREQGFILGITFTFPLIEG